MEKEMNEKKKTKSITKKAKKIRSIVMMSLLCVLMLSAATYAWFTLSNTAKVSNLTMTVGEATGLQIAPNKGTSVAPVAGDYSGVLIFGDSNSSLDNRIKGTAYGSGGEYIINGQLLPATTSDGKFFSSPNYDDEGNVDSVTDEMVTVDKLDNLVQSFDKTGYYYETEFYLKSLGETIEVRLREATVNDSKLNSKGKYVANVVGTYVLDKTNQTNAKENVGSAAIRISLTSSVINDNGEENEGKTIVYEPNCDDNHTGTYANDRSNTKNDAETIVTSKQKMDGTFSEETTTITLEADEDTLIRMRIWIEGTDDQCVNEINLKNIIAQLQFEEVTTTEGN